VSEKDFIGFTLSKLQEVGPRPSASSKEWDFLRFIKECLESLGITTGWEAFPAPSSYTWGHLFLWLGMAQAGFLLWVAPLWSLIWSMVVLFLEYAELATFPLVSALFRFGESANVVGDSLLGGTFPFVLPCLSRPGTPAPGILHGIFAGGGMTTEAGW